MQCTSAEANKLLRKFREEYNNLKGRESRASVFIVTLGEDPETIRPVYDYEEMQKSIEQVNQKIIRLKHAINVFNTTTEVPGFNMTIDQMLVYIPQLTATKSRLNDMANRLPKQRTSQDYIRRGYNLVEYDYANYDIDKAAKDLSTVAERLANAQTALDKLNSTVKFEVDL